MNDNYLSFIKERQLIPGKAVPMFNHVGTAKAKAKRHKKRVPAKNNKRRSSLSFVRNSDVLMIHYIVSFVKINA